MNAPETIAAPAGEIVAYSELEASLTALKARMTGVAYDLTTTKGDKAARADRAALVKLRGAIEERRVALKQPHLDAAREIDAIAKRITLEVTALEKPIDEQIKADEARRERERKARQEAEAERVAGHIATLGKLNAGTVTVLTPPAAIQARIDEITAIDTSAMEEFAAKGAAAKDIALTTLGEILRAAQLHIAEQESLRAQREALERQEAEAAAARRAEEERLAAERAEFERQQREAQEAAERAERERWEAAEAERLRVEAAAKAERERQEAEQKRARQAEQARLAAERRAIQEREQRFIKSQDRIVSALRNAAGALEQKVETRQDGPDSPPEPADEWSYHASPLAHECRVLADELVGA